MAIGRPVVQFTPRIYVAFWVVLGAAVILPTWWLLWRIAVAVEAIQ